MARMKAGGTAYDWLRLGLILAGVALVIFLVVKLYGWIKSGASWVGDKAGELFQGAKETAGKVASGVNAGVIAPTGGVVNGIAATGAAVVDLIQSGTVSQETIDAGREASKPFTPPIEDILTEGGSVTGIYLD